MVYVIYPSINCLETSISHDEILSHKPYKNWQIPFDFRGLIQPIMVRPIKKGEYEILAGERHWRAAQLAQLFEITCLVFDYDDEQAVGLWKLMDEFNYQHEELAQVISKSRTWITNALRLSKLDLDEATKLTAKINDPEMQRFERSLSNQFGAAVKIDENEKAGRWLKIRYFDYETLAGFLEKMSVVYE